MQDNELDSAPTQGAATEVPIAHLLTESRSIGWALNRSYRSDQWRVLDTRSATSFRNGHIPGSIHLTPHRWPHLLYLLPPRRRKLCVVGGSPSEARSQAEQLLRIGWPTVGYSTVPASGLPRESQATGPSDTVLWEPSPWLQKVADDGLPATGDGLDLACGSGRNTVYLASLLGPALSGAGALYGVDILPDALAQAREVRERAGLALSAREALSADGTLPAHGTLPAGRTFPAHGTLSTRLPAHFHRADLSSKSGQRRWLPAARWSVIVVFRYLDREILPLIAESLQPGGHLVYETFLEEQRVRRGSPRSDRHLLQPGELPLTFASLETLRYEEGEDEDGNVLASFWARRP